MKLAATSIEITNALKKAGFIVSKSYGRNSGSVIVMKSKGFNVSKSNRNSKFKGGVVSKFVVSSDDNNYLSEIKSVLKNLGYVTSEVKFNELFIAGQFISK